MKLSWSSSSSSSSFSCDSSTISLFAEHFLANRSSLDIVPWKLNDYPLRDCMKITSHPSFKFSIFWQKDSNHGTTLAGKTRNKVCYDLFKPLRAMIAFLSLMRSKIPRLWSEWMWVMKIVRMSNRISSYL